nr:PQQ-dependent sugar dehydrogenase [Flavihumibacter rivuli]
MLFAFLFSSCGGSSDTATPEVPVAGEPETETNVVVTGYEVIWGMDFLPNGDLLFTEKRGKLYRRSNGQVTELTGFPAVRTGGQGGLLDIRVHPNYAQNGWIYASYSANAANGSGELRLVRFKLNGNAIQEVQQLFSTNGGNTWANHWGSRIAFDGKGHLFLSVGEGGTTSYAGPQARNRNAQDLASPWGKIHRMTDDGKVPTDNPVMPGATAPSTLYAYGVRNPQGLAIHPTTGELWETEHGPRGGDEINIINKAANYGWPNYSIGVNYDGTTISSGHDAPGITPPIHTWTPSVGTCGMAFITSASFKDWKGDLLVSGLASGKLYRVKLKGNQVESVHEMPGIKGRTRNVVQAPDGSIYVSMEGPGRILAITVK